MSPNWRKRYALPAAAVVGWTDDRTASALGTGIVRDGVIAVGFGTNDTVLARANRGARCIARHLSQRLARA